MAGDGLAAPRHPHHPTPPPPPFPQLPIVTVTHGAPSAAAPAPGDVVTARVLRITPRLAALEVVCVGDAPLDAPLTGVIRAQDVRATEVDKVDVSACFRPGDVVRARVSSLGDARSYYLTTAADELGVVHALGPAGVPLVPLSWQEMQCPVTRGVEARKVARAATHSC